MTYEPASEADFRQRLLASPGERQNVDYKSAMSFGTDDAYTLKLLRHMQGMANAGGGWLIIGYNESTPGLPQPDPAHSDLIAASYEPTIVSKAANLYVERRQELKITVFLEMNGSTGLRYPMVRIEGFERTPYVCRSTKVASDTKEPVLEQGVVYLRRHEAATSKVFTPEDWEQVIARCLQLRRDEFLSQFKELFERMSAPADTSFTVPSQGLGGWLADARDRAFQVPPIQD